VATKFEYAQLAARVYARSDSNRVPIPAGWTESDWISDLGDGFSAGTYKKGGEMVISFTGTNEFTDFIGANIPLATGGYAQQLVDAVIYYENVKAANPGMRISFTGHSLGGGLASLMGVLFNRHATVFAPAPFHTSAVVQSVLDTINSTLTSHGFVDNDFATYYNATSQARQSMYDQRR